MQALLWCMEWLQVPHRLGLLVPQLYNLEFLQVPQPDTGMEWQLAPQLCNLDWAPQRYQLCTDMVVR